VIEVLSDEIEERGQLRVPGSFGCLFSSLIDSGEKREDLLQGKKVYVSFTKLGGQFRDDRLVGFDGIFLMKLIILQPTMDTLKDFHGAPP